MIYKMFDGRHIDLSRVVAVGDIHLAETAFVTEIPVFDVWFQLMDKPMTWERGSKISNEERKAMNAAEKAAFLRAKSEGKTHREIGDAIVGAQKPFLAKGEADFAAAHQALLEAWQGLVERAA